MITGVIENSPKICGNMDYSIEFQFMWEIISSHTTVE
jgi:hypothetical protein